MPTILVANVGSTSFKYKLFQGDRVHAHGRIERIGETSSPQTHVVGDRPITSTDGLPTYADAVRTAIDHLTTPETGPVADLNGLDAI